ncbi:hypothetical protein C8Q76DRAFT_135085 [Earliella scabrosa]|nr:hypothetical protein C8Q76DRAFT_135085 [Earliella scabrosa]
MDPLWRPSPARCNQCLQVFPSKSKATQHAKVAGHWPPECTRLCTECGETFQTNSEQHEHLERTGHMKLPDAPAGPLATTIGGSAEPEHRQIPKQPTAREQSSTQTLAATTEYKRVNDPKTCPICFVRFQTNVELAKHVMTTASCNTCKICLPPGQTLDEHRWDSVMHPNCHSCSLAFDGEDEWSVHQATYHSMAPRASTTPPNQDTDQIVSEIFSMSCRGTAPSASSVSESLDTITTPRQNMIPSVDALESHPPRPAEDPLIRHETTARSPSPPISLPGSIPDRLTGIHTLPPSMAIGSPTQSQYLDLSSNFMSMSRHSPQAAHVDCTTITSLDVPAPMETRLRKAVAPAPELSWHCRSCLRQPCVDPVATVCGHLLCYECILRELRTRMCCPVCKTVFLIRLM